MTFTQNQIKELATKYGQIDIMWFDAGWVCKHSGQDIRLGEVIEESIFSLLLWKSDHNSIFSLLKCDRFIHV